MRSSVVIFLFLLRSLCFSAEEPPSAQGVEALGEIGESHVVIRLKKKQQGLIFVKSWEKSGQSSLFVKKEDQFTPVSAISALGERALWRELEGSCVDTITMKFDKPLSIFEGEDLYYKMHFLRKVKEGVFHEEIAYIKVDFCSAPH